MIPLESVITWFWKPHNGYRSQFCAEHVNVLERMVRRHYRRDVRFICVTDSPDGLSPDIEVIPAWNDWANIPSPHGGNNPSCYRRLRLFHPDAHLWFGKRYVSLDIDCVITADMSPVWDKPNDIVLWGDTNPKNPYNGSMMLMHSGVRRQVWTDFKGEASAKEAMKAGFYGSDQGWIGYKLGWREPRWGLGDGVLSYRIHVQPNGRQLPKDSRIVFFHGQEDPWSPEPQRLSWVQEHWR